MPFWSSSNGEINPLGPGYHGRIEVRGHFGDAELKEIISAVDNGAKIEQLYIYGDVGQVNGSSSLAMASLVDLAEMVIRDNIHYVQSQPTEQSKVSNAPVPRTYSSKGVTDVLNIENVTFRAEKIRKQGLVEGEEEAAKTGALTFRMSPRQAAKAAVFTSYIAKGIYKSTSEQRYMDYDIAGITYSEAPHSHDIHTPPIDILPPKMGSDGVYFRLKVDPLYSRTALAERTGLDLNKLKRADDNNQNHYILIPETEIDRLLGVAKEKERSR
jgi:hypothetical protein